MQEIQQIWNRLRKSVCFVSQKHLPLQFKEDDIREKTIREQGSIDPYEDEEMVDDLYVPPTSQPMPMNPFKRAKTDALLVKLMSGQQLTDEEYQYLQTLN